MAPEPVLLPDPRGPLAVRTSVRPRRLHGRPALLAALALALLALPWAVRPARAADPGNVAEGGHAPKQSQASLLHQLKDGDAQQRQDALTALADQGNERAVPSVAAALYDKDATVRELAEEALWEIWSRSGNPKVDVEFRIGANLLAEGLNAEAVTVFTRVIKMAPDFAEGYNKRATAYYELGEYEKSLADIAQVLKRNPYHFGALSGAGLCLVGLGRLNEAVVYFNRALKINPNMDTIRQLRDTIVKQQPHPLI